MTYVAGIRSVGQFVDVGMYDAVLALSELIVWNYSYDKKVTTPRGSGHPMLCPFDLFPAKEARSPCATAPRSI